MNATSPLPADTINAATTRRTSRKWTAIVMLALALLLSGAGWLYQRVTEQSRVLAAIEAAGGKYHSPYGAQRFAYVLDRLMNPTADPNVLDVLLNGPEFDDAWLALQHDLRALPIDELVITDTRLSRDAVMRLLDSNDLISFIVAGVPLTNADAEAIGREHRLAYLNVQQSDITDAGLRAINSARLISLDVSGTPITSAALQQELQGSRLQYLGLDGKQLTPELAATIAGISTLTMIRLAGPDVTDAHVKLLEGIPRQLYVNIDQTSVSADVIESLKAANPPGYIEIHDSGSALYKWRAK